MKKIFQSFLFLATSATIFSCNEKLNIAAPYKDITVVYGLLNKGDTAHYIRIQKAFMDENQSAIDMAKIADSSFYNALDVKIKELNTSGNLVSTIALTKVDLTNEGYPKQSGSFFNTPNYAYKFKHALNSDYSYRIIITNKKTGNVDSSITNIINNEEGAKFGVREWKGGVTQRVSFAKIFRDNGKLEEISYFTDLPTNVGVAELVLRFNWTDSNIITKKSTKKFADYSNFYEASTFTPGVSNNLAFASANRNIYDFLRVQMGVPSDPNEYHFMDSCDMFLYAAGIEYYRYKELNTNKGGLTADEIRPTYTNIKGKNVMGLFSTKAYIQKLQIAIGLDTKDSLTNGVQFKDLSIRF